MIYKGTYMYTYIVNKGNHGIKEVGSIGQNKNERLILNQRLEINERKDEK